MNLDIFTMMYEAANGHPEIKDHLMANLDDGYKSDPENWYLMSRYASSYLNRLIIQKTAAIPRTMSTSQLHSECRQARAMLGDIREAIDIAPWISEFKTELLPTLAKIW